MGQGGGAQAASMAQARGGGPVCFACAHFRGVHGRYPRVVDLNLGITQNSPWLPTMRRDAPVFCCVCAILVPASCKGNGTTVRVWTRVASEYCVLAMCNDHGLQLLAGLRALQGPGTFPNTVSVVYSKKQVLEALRRGGLSQTVYDIHSAGRPLGVPPGTHSVHAAWGATTWFPPPGPNPGPGRWPFDASVASMLRRVDVTEARASTYWRLDHLVALAQGGMLTLCP